jgi:hypothetical protein
MSNLVAANLAVAGYNFFLTIVMRVLMLMRVKPPESVLIVLVPWFIVMVALWLSIYKWAKF